MLLLEPKERELDLSSFSPSVLAFRSNPSQLFTQPDHSTRISLSPDPRCEDVEPHSIRLLPRPRDPSLLAHSSSSLALLQLIPLVLPERNGHVCHEHNVGDHNSGDGGVGGVS